MPIKTAAVKRYEIVIGLEIHVELLTISKMFCGCRVAFGAEPNTNTCPVCLGMPGSLPVVNKKAVEYTIKTGLALNSNIALNNQFHRKNYFYPDMPKDYQISQYDMPLCVGGYLDVDVSGASSRVGITRVHLEEDTGKMLHQSKTGRIANADYSLVDFNRAGTPLMEIVSEPDIRTPKEARAFMQKLRRLIVAIGVSDCNMEEGSMRCDANISLRPLGAAGFGVKSEIKNMNSFRALQRALEYEIERQENLLQAGEEVLQETRHWNANKNITTSLRSKEEAHDYRYFPDPDLVPIELDRAWVDSIRDSLPELPAARRDRLIRDFGLTFYDADFMTSSTEMGDYFEESVKLLSEPKIIGNWMMGELSAHLNAAATGIERSPVSPKQLTDLIKLINEGVISGKVAKEVFAEMFTAGKDPQIIVEEKGLRQISDESAVTDFVDEVIEANPAAAAEFKAGKKQAVGFLVGQVMKASRGRANPKLVNRILQKKLQ